MPRRVLLERVRAGQPDDGPVAEAEHAVAVRDGASLAGGEMTTAGTRPRSRRMMGRRRARGPGGQAR
jgi:hypothetical protein